MIENNKRKEVLRMGKLIRVDFRKAIKIQEAMQKNQYRYDKDYKEQLMPDNVVPMFLENQIA